MTSDYATPDRLPPRPFSPFVRLVLGAAVTALVGEWARFQGDLAWAALPLGAGTVITLASVTRGVAARRRWRRLADAYAASDEPAPPSRADLPVPSGREPWPRAEDPDTVTARRSDAGTVSIDLGATATGTQPFSEAPERTADAARESTDGDRTTSRETVAAWRDRSD